MLRTEDYRMRFLYLTTGCFDKGGVSRFSRYQLRAARELYGPDNVRCLSLLGPDEQSFEEPCTVTWHGTRGGLVNKLRFTRRALSAAALWRPTIVHSAHVHLAGVANAAARLAGGVSLVNVYGLEIWSGLTKRRRQALDRAGKVIADCEFTAEYVVANQLHSQRPTVVHDCVDLARFYPGECPDRILEKYGIFSKAEHFVALTLGRLSKGAAHKGYDRLLRVFASLAHTHHAARLVIAGRGDDRSRLEGLARDLKIDEKVRFTGAIEECDLADVYRAATVFSLVSDRGHGRGEGIPLTPLEAMACGVPIIVGNEDGSQECVIDGRNGFVVAPFNLAQHEFCLRTLLEEPSRLAVMSGAGLELSQKHFTYTRFVQQMRKIYENIGSLTAERTGIEAALEPLGPLTKPMVQSVQRSRPIPGSTSVVEKR
jgi:phosphatidylinositol alpha-1,6-mannosyltransferase